MEIKKTKINYVNNAEMLKQIINYKKECRSAKRNGLKKPQIPEIIGKQLLLIAENLSHKPNFYSYPCKEEMQGDGIENCIMYFDNFDPKKSKNPFAYFTQIIYYAYLRRIQKEKKQLFTKYKFAEHHGVMGNMEQYESEDGVKHHSLKYMRIFQNSSKTLKIQKNVKRRN
jgi:hypothetical protein